MPAVYAYNVGMKPKQKSLPVQLTVRGVPSSVKKVLENRAKKERKSLNNILVEVLCSAASKDTERVFNDLDYLAGSWVEDPEFDAALKDFEQIDSELWK